MATADLLPPPETLLPDEDFYEIVDDELRENLPMSALAVFLANVLSRSLSEAGRRANAGMSVVEILFVLCREPKLQRRPDVAFVSYERWGAGPPHDENAWDTVPNLTVEIVSPTNTVEEVERKLVEYLAAGVEQVWILHPSRRRMYIHESLTQVRVVTETDAITWEAMLPGFSLRLADLFAQLEPPRP